MAFDLSSSRTLPLALPLLLALYTYHLTRPPRRHSKIPPHGERVLVLGGTSGIGRAIARQYAARGALVCIVGRREALLEDVRRECLFVKTAREEGEVDEEGVLALKGDFADVDDMVRVREVLQDKWKGLDTLIVAAGVSALQPLLAVAGSSSMSLTTREGIQHASDVSVAAVRGNYTGPLVAAVTFIPLLLCPNPVSSRPSPSPSILLVSSLASVIPAPTRTLYGSTKAASTLLYQSLAIEHPRIAFSVVMPSTVEGDFRAGAVDGGEVRESDPNKTGLKREDVAKRCIKAVDGGERTVFVPGLMRYAFWVSWVWPAVVERAARRKYKYPGPVGA